MRVCALVLLATMLMGCATWRPEGDARYYCVNTDVYFTVRYVWGASPSAQLRSTAPRQSIFRSSPRKPEATLATTSTSPTRGYV